MSFTDTRVLLATALKTVTGLVGHQYRPAIVKTGSAWPQLVSVDRGPGDAFKATWVVMVALGGDERAALNLADDVFPELVDELDPIAYVESAQPVTLQIGGTNMHALQVAVTSD